MTITLNTSGLYATNSAGTHNTFTMRFDAKGWMSSRGVRMLGNHIHIGTPRCWSRGRKRGMSKADYVYKGLHGYQLTEGGVFVRGTMDTKLAEESLAECDIVRDDAPEDEDWEPKADTMSAGYWRFVPCSPSHCGEHGWHLVSANPKGPGTVFPGVMLDGIRAESIEYDCDNPWPED